MSRRSGVWRTAVALVVTAMVILGWAAPASAHIEVEADKPQAGATDVTVTFVAESESASAGIVSLAVTLPAGIAPAEATYVSGPAGWSLTQTATGYTVTGPVLPVGQDVTYQIKIVKLPVDAPSLPFKTLQTYSDGRIDRWIGIQEPGGPPPDMPAPILEVTGAAPAQSVSTSAAPPVASPTPTATPTPAVTASDAAGNASSGSSTAWWVAGVLALVAAVVALSLWLRRRRGPGTTAGSA